ncbi:hypothetical protein [Burkholderia sp. Bp9143]|uniref:hypothetical protein n=1 Tax=Burkholderia sp. Bp9143 TaxID=2184574 RepID=UPI0026C5840A
MPLNPPAVVYLNKFLPFRITNGGAGGKGGANYNLFSAGVDYFLSKRADVYTVAVFEKASGTDSLGQPAVAQITGLTPSATDKQVSLRIGMRHRF